MTPKMEKALAWLPTELQHGSVPVTVLLEHAIAAGLNRGHLKNAKRALGIVTIRERNPKTARTIRWRWSLPTPLKPHAWGLYGYRSVGNYYYMQGEACTFKELLKQPDLTPPLWVLLTSDPALVLPLRLAEGAVAALGTRWRRLEDLPARKVVRRKPRTTQKAFGVRKHDECPQEVSCDRSLLNRCRTKGREA